ncbi:MAG: outer membrane beta-barrel protein [Parachlamydiales bacterium]
MNSSLMAWDCCDSSECFDSCESNRMYIGAFGGGIYSNSTKISQMGTAYFTEAVGGPLAVYAQGPTKKTSSGFGGAQIGYEWSRSPLNIGCSDWSIASAVELEGYWYSYTKRGHLINPTDRLPEHDFLDSFQMDAGVYLANAVFSLNNSCFRAFSPYVGGGIGATRISIRNATSLQTSPEEAGINHFNSKRSDSSWAFAAQAKAGLRYNVCESFHIFGEYRYLFVDSSNYIFGSTVYPTHAPTSPWNVKVQNSQYNAFVFGLQYDL